VEFRRILENQGKNKWQNIMAFPCFSCPLSLFSVTLLKVHCYLYLRAVCGSKDPFFRDERTAAEVAAFNYKGSLPWELTAGCSASTSDTVTIIQLHVNFPSVVCIKNKMF
jgi:hypothetical protein